MSEPEPAPNSAFRPEEWAAFVHEDRHAAAAIFLIAVSVFSFGIVLYSVVVYSCL
jgi:hypothetical protein